MSLKELCEAVVLGMPDRIGGSFQIGCSLPHRVFVKAVEAGFVDDIDDCFLGTTDGEGGVCGNHLPIGLHLQDGAEMNTLLRVSCRMPCLCQLVSCCLGSMRDLCGHNNLAVDVILSSKADGDELVRMRGEIFSGEALPSTHIALIDQRIVKLQYPGIVTHSPFVLINEIDVPERLVEL